MWSRSASRSSACSSSSRLPTSSSRTTTFRGGMCSAALPGELAFEHAANVDLLSARRKRDDLRDHACAPLVLAREAVEEGVGLVALRRPARRPYSGAAAESVDLDAGVLSEHPDVRRRAFAPEARLD